MQDPSGTWVTPAFILHQSKLDEVRPQQAALQPLQRPRRADLRQGCRTAWFTHIIFDCDGVLVDTERASCQALQMAILQVTGVQPNSTALLEIVAIVAIVAWCVDLQTTYTC